MIDNTIPSVPDARDYIYAASGGNFPLSLDLKPYSYEIEDQGAIGSCSCNSTISACEMLRPGSYSRLFAYYNARIYGNRIGQEGAQLRDVMNSMRLIGTVMESDYPYDIALQNTPPPSNYYDVNSPVKRYWINKYENVFDGMSADRDCRLKSALNAGMPVVIGAVVRNDLPSLSGAWQAHKLSLTAPEIGNHAMLLIGYDDNARCWLVQNSWGRQFGDGGYFGYGYDNLTQDCFEGWVINSFAGCVPRPATNKSHSKIFMGADGAQGDQIAIANSGVTVVGSNGTDYVKIFPNVVDVHLDANVDTLELPGLKQSYQLIPKSGLGLQIISGAPVATFLSINNELEVLFHDGAARIRQTGFCTFDIDGVSVSG